MAPVSGGVPNQAPCPTPQQPTAAFYRQTPQYGPPPVLPQAPATQGSGTSVAMVVGVTAAAAALGIAVVVGVAAARHHSTSNQASDLASNASAGAMVASPTGTTDEDSPRQTYTEAPRSTVTSAPEQGSAAGTDTDGATDENSAEAKLRRQVEQDRPAVEALVGYWLPQLSAKRPGLTAHGITYDYRSIWADYQTNHQAHPDALLLWSGDFSTFRYQDFWITVVPSTFGDGASANSWCVDQGIGKDDCYAKRLAHTGGYAGNTLTRN